MKHNSRLSCYHSNNYFSLFIASHWRWLETLNFNSLSPQKPQFQDQEHFIIIIIAAHGHTTTSLRVLYHRCTKRCNGCFVPWFGRSQ
ncbi:hypothetical protein CsSME_00033304 [Camellia sinensis var. sinensis]